MIVLTKSMSGSAKDILELIERLLNVFFGRGRT